MPHPLVRGGYRKTLPNSATDSGHPAADPIRPSAFAAEGRPKSWTLPSDQSDSIRSCTIPGCAAATGPICPSASSRHRLHQEKPLKSWLQQEFPLERVDIIIGELCCLVLLQSTVLPGGKRIPGLKLDHPRQLAVMHSLVRFANIAAGGSFTTADLYAPALDVLGVMESQYSLASLRYDLSKLRAKGLVEKVPRSRRYRLIGKGYSICLVFLKLFEKIYAPLTAGLLAPFSGDRILAEDRRCQLDRLYQRICDNLDAILRAVGLKIAA